MDWAERKKAYLAGTALPPIVEFLGMDVLSAGEGTACIRMGASEKLANAMGTLHGGVLCDLGDVAMGYALASALEEGEIFTTLELKINFFKPVQRAVLTAIASVVKRTRTIAYVECNVMDEAEKLVARLGSTCLISTLRA